MSQTDLTVDELSSKACKASLDIQSLLEQNSPNLLEAYTDFHKLAIDALDAQEVRMNDIKQLSIKMADDVSRQKTYISNLSEDLIQFQEEVERSKNEIIKYNNQIEVQKNTNEKLKEKYQKRRTIIPEITFIHTEIGKLRASQSGDKKTEELEKNRQIDLQKQIDQIIKQTNDIVSRTASVIKKNRMKESDLEKKIQRSSSNSNLVSTGKKVRPHGKTMIVHRTQDSSADEVRLLHTSMEEALNTNTAVKAQIKNLLTDLNAVREENAALKALMRNVMGQEK